MNNLIKIISQPWPWYVAGPIIAFIMFCLLFFGNRLGISSNLKTMCAVLGAGKSCEYFSFNWKSEVWNLVFVIGLILGGTIAHLYLTPSTTIHISEATILELKDFGIDNPGGSLVPASLFSWKALFSIKGFFMIVIGGFLVGFGTRYASGCTSGHAISGLSNLQLPSLIAVIGFFLGGLFVTYLIFPLLLTA